MLRVSLCICVCVLVLSPNIKCIFYCGLRVKFEKYSFTVDEPLHFIAEETDALKVYDLFKIPPSTRTHTHARPHTL